MGNGSGASEPAVPATDKAEGKFEKRHKGTLSGSVARGVAWLSLARFITLFISILSMAILARLLAPEDFGAFAVLTAILSIPLAIYEGAIGLSLVQQQRIDDEFVRATFWLGQGIAWVLTLLIVCTAPAAGDFFGIANLAPALICISLTVPLKAATAVSMSLMQRQHKFVGVAALGSVSMLGNLVVAVPLALLGWKLWALVAATIAGGLAETAIGYALVRYPFKLPRRGHSRAAQRISALYALTQLFNALALAVPNIAVGRILGPAALGFYSRAWRLLEMAIGVTAGPIQRTLIPAFAGLQHDPQRAGQSLARALAISTTAFGIISVVVVLEANAIVRLVLGAQWDSVILPTQILFAAFVPRAAYKLTESVALAFGQAGQTALRQGLLLALLTAGGLIGARFGIAGVAAGVALAMWAFYLWSLIWAARATHSRALPLVLIHTRALFVTAVIGLAGWIALQAAVPLGFWIAHAASAAAALLAGAILLATPRAVLGGDLAWARSELLKATRKFGSQGKRAATA